MLSLARIGRPELSLLQAQRWAADRLEPGGHHNLALAVRCSAVPRPAALERALDAFASGHELLRMTFPGSGGRPTVRLQPGAVRELSFVDLRGTAAHDAEVHARLAEFARRPFDVERGPLWRVAVLRGAGDGHLVVAAAHRLIADRDSLRLLLRRSLQSGAEAASPRRGGRDAPAPLDVERELSLWRAELSSLEPMALPTDHPRPHVSLRRRGREPLAVAADAVRELDALAASLGVDAALGFAAAAEVLLHRYGGRGEVSLGFAERPGGLDRFGPFARLLLLRNEVPDQGAAGDLLAAIVEALSRARGRGALDVETAAEALGVGGHEFGVPVPQVALAVEDSAAQAGPWSEVIDIDTGVGRADLFFHLCREADGGVRGYLEYDRDLFEPGTAERITTHFVNSIRGLAAREPLARVSLLGDAERARVVACSNASGVRQTRAERVQDLFEAQVDRAPQRVALISLDDHLTYADLEARANRLASHLGKCGVGPGAIVAILLERSIDAIIAILGVLKSGGAWLPLDPGFPRERMEAILADAGARLAITDSALEARIAGTVDVLRLDAERLRIDLRSAARPAPCVSGRDLAYVIYTSGSTGKPKGVAVEHGSLASYTEAAAGEYGIAASDRVLQFASLSFDASIEEIFPTLCCGGTLVLRPEWMLDSVELFLRKCAEWKITLLSLPTAYWHEVARKVGSGEERLPESLRLVVIGGEAARADLVAAWIRRVGRSVRLLNTYGPTETTVVATCWDAASADPELPPREVPIGRPLANSSAYVLGPGLQLLPFGVMGELYVGGAGVARGYVGQPALTAERFLLDPFAGEGRRMYRTGDRCRLMPDGELEFAGRADDQVKVRGFRVEPGEIEAELTAHPAIEHAAVVPRAMAGGGTRLVAYVVGRERIEGAEIRAFLRARLPDFMVPSGIVFLDRFPLNSSGKIDRRALPHAAEVEPQRVAVARTPMEEMVGRVFCEALHRGSVGTRDAFFSIGGSSLAAVQIAAALSERLGHPIDAQDVLETSTIEALAERISGRLTGTARRPATPDDLAADVLLDPVIRAPAFAPEPPPLGRAAVFLTGATGFFGAFLLRALLERTSGTVRCLVRAEDAAQARVRLSAAWRRIAGSGASLPDRVIAAAGDLARPKLGMTGAQWDAVAEEADCVFHAGATISYLLPYRALRGANVLGTEEVLRLAAHRKPKPVHYVSTVDVAAADGVRAPERDGLVDPGSLAGGYAQSKWVAERLAAIARERGIPVAIYRPGRLVGDSRTGVANEKDFLLRLVQACVRAGVLPDLDLHLDMTPVDYASAALAALASAGAANRVFHLVHPEPVPWTVLSRALGDFGYRLGVLPFTAWTAALRRSGRRSEGDAFALYVAGLEESRLRATLEAVHGCERTLADLAPHEVRCPKVDGAVLHVHLAHLVRSGLLPRPG